MHDKDPRAIKFGLFCSSCVLLTISIIWLANTGPYYGTYELPDYIATGVFVALLSWLLLPDIRLDRGHLDDPGNGFALRLGKATKRCLSLLKRLRRPAGSD